MIPLLVIAGATASGKTSVALELARRLDAEIVGADSMQVYRGFDIGTATPTAQELGEVPHHMLSFVPPDTDYDAAAFAKDADRVISEIHSRKKRVIVAGGTGLYIRVLLHGLQAGPPPDPALRAEISRRAEAEGWPALHTELKELDPPAAARLHPNDGVRILRAMEVSLGSEKTLSEWQAEHRFNERRYPFLLLCLDREREELNRRIALRTDEMMAAGFLDEVRGLLDDGCSPSLKPMQGLGYKRLVQHLGGELSLEEAVEKIKTDTRRLAKRQRNWFSRETDVRFVAPRCDEIASSATSFFEDFGA